MNTTALLKVAEIVKLLAAHPGEGEGDRRAVSSPLNGLAGGRPTIGATAIAEAFLAHYRTHVRWCHGSFYEYDQKTGYWRIRTEREMGVRIAAFLNQHPIVNRKIVPYSRSTEADVVGALRGTENIDLTPPCFLDTGKSAEGWAAMENGLLDIEAAAKGEIGTTLPSFTPNFFSTRHFPFKWEPGAQCPRFLRFLEQVQPAPDGREMLQLLAGLLLVSDTSYNAFFVLLGEGGCGKSTFLKIIGGLLGEDNCCSVALAEMSEKHTSHRLTRTLANLVDDSATVDGSKFGQSLAGAEGLLKRVTSGARIHCEPKFVDSWDAPATARCVFCANPPLPQFADRSHALWDRLRIVPFTVRFRGTPEQNSRLADEILADELPGIFAWAVRGLGALRKLKTFPQCEAGAKIIEMHRAECDKESIFLTDRYRYQEGATTPSRSVYKAYAEWCKDGGYFPKNAGNFAGEVRRVFPGVTGPKKSRGTDGQVWRYSNLAPIEEQLPLLNSNHDKPTATSTLQHEPNLRKRLENFLNRGRSSP